jgi:hypothetical protein
MASRRSGARALAIVVGVVVALGAASPGRAVPQEPAPCVAAESHSGKARMMNGMRPGELDVALARPRGAPPPRRFIDVERAATSGRFRAVDCDSSAARAVTQYQLALKGRLSVDSTGKLAVGFGVFTGSGFTGGWNAVAGRGGGVAVDFNLKQLFLAARPGRSFALEYGGLEIEHGESTEVTS